MVAGTYGFIAPAINSDVDRGGRDMVLSREDRAELAKLFETLTPDHVSSIVAALGEPGSLIGTAKDSTKYTFFQKMAALGLAVEVPLPEEFDPEVRASITSFALSAEAGPEIESLLNEHPGTERRRHRLTPEANSQAKMRRG